MKILNRNENKNIMLPQNRPSFNGALTRYAVRHPLSDSITLQRVSEVFTRDENFIGVFPREFIKAIKKNLFNPSKNDIAESVSLAKQAFREAGSVFKEHASEIIKRHKDYCANFNLDTYYQFETTRLALRVAEDKSKALEIFNKERDSFLPSAEFIQDIETRAAEVLERGLKKANVLPAGSKVEVKRLNEGNFGTAYQVSFLDPNGNKLFKDKVIKYYKTFEDVHQCFYDIDIKKYHIIKEHYPEILKFQTRMFNEHPERNNPVMQEKFAKYAQEIDTIFNMPFDQYEARTKEKFKGIASIIENNGIQREALVAGYISHAVGHDLSKSDLIKYHYTDLNSNFALEDYASTESLGAVTKHVDYGSLGISPIDIKGFSAFYNFVAGRLVDYGNFSTDSQNLALNAVARRIYKKIKHISGKTEEETNTNRLKKINELQSMAISNEIGQNSDVFVGIAEAKRSLVSKSS